LSSSEHFEHSKDKAVREVLAARAKRAETETLGESWDMQDHLVALNARIRPLRAIGTQLVDAAIQVHRALWPKVKTPTCIDELATKLKGAEARLREWRCSSARAGADKALVFVLSWYEDVEIHTVTSLRRGSPWNSTPDGIAKRQAAADRFASYANTRTFDDGRLYSEDEESSDEEAASGEESSEGEDIDFEEPESSKGKAGKTTEVAEGSDDDFSFDEPPNSKGKSGKAVATEVISSDVADTPATTPTTEVASATEVVPAPEVAAPEAPTATTSATEVSGSEA